MSNTFKRLAPLVVISGGIDYGIALRESLVEYSCLGLLRSSVNLAVLRSSEIGRRESIDSFCDLCAQLWCLGRELRVRISSSR